MSIEIAMQRLAMMGDWLKLQDFDSRQLLNEIEEFSADWKPYNPRKKNNRFGLSVTSLDGGLSGIPDLDSLYEYNKSQGVNLNNQSFQTTTDVYHRSTELQRILKPYKEWLGRCHFIRLDAGGYFPEHYDIDKMNFKEHEVRLIGFVNKTRSDVYKFCYEDRLMTGLEDGQLYYFNAHKKHSVFSMDNNTIQLIITLRFDLNLYERLIEQYACK